MLYLHVGDGSIAHHLVAFTGYITRGAIVKEVRVPATRLCNRHKRERWCLSARFTSGNTQAITGKQCVQEAGVDFVQPRWYDSG